MQFQHRMIAPAAHIAAMVNTFYVIETEAERIDELMPAYSAQVLVLVRGSVRITFADGRVMRSGQIALNAPQLRGAACVLEGPATLVGASLTPVGWLTLANLPVDEVHEQLVPAEAVFTLDQIAMLQVAAAACRAGRARPEDLCAQLGDVIAAGPFAPKPEHLAVIEAITQWLGSGFDPPLADLQAAVGVSPRQLQRISRRFLGVAPAQALKRHRAIRAAMLLANPALSDTLREEMLGTYFDQAHLIRDIRRYTGRTPTQLRVQSLSSNLLDPAGHGDTARFLRGPEP